MPTLFTFAISHYAEKARWALDHKRAVYEERRLLPGPHVFVTRRLAKETSVPILVDEERTIQGSSAIIDHCDARFLEDPLTPEAPVERAQARDLEQWLDRELGETLRRAFYVDALRHREVVVPLFTQGGPWWGRPFYGLAFGVVARAIRQMYAISAERAAADRAILDAVFERTDGLLASRPYLVGNRFSRADLTLAALSGPLFDPPEHPISWPPAELYPPPLAELRDRWRKTRTCEHVLGMYREHRGQTGVTTERPGSSSHVEVRAREILQ
jgi:glutathione S-transferase